jgi:hypothetical protein
MERYLMIFRASFALLCATAIADAAYVALPSVDTMSCDQMMAELVVAGQRMNSQLDPEFATEAQAMAAQAQGASGAGAIAQGVGMSVACSIPGVSMFCMAAMQAQALTQGAQAEQNFERMQTQMERLEKAMEGIDVERMQALSQRFEAQACKVPQQ